MPKLKKPEPIELGDINAALITWLQREIRRNRILHTPEPPPALRQEQLEIMLASIEANQPLRILQSDLKQFPHLQADAYIYYPGTQTFEATH